MNFIRFYLLFIILILPFNLYAAEWIQITSHESEIIFANSFPIQTSELNYEKFKKDKKTNWYWVENKNYQDPLRISVSLYRMPTNYYVSEDRVYKPKKNIEKFLGKDKYNWLSERKTFKSLNILAAYRQFEFEEYLDKCFIFGIHFSGKTKSGYKESGKPWCILEGYICKDTSFNSHEIEDIINQIGVKKIRPL